MKSHAIFARNELNPSIKRKNGFLLSFLNLVWPEAELKLKLYVRKLV
jgi:hypothetical protein